MNSRVQCGVTAGVVIVGASVVAVAPMSLPTPTAQENPQVTAAVELTAVSDPLETAIILAQGLAESGQRAGGAAALSPLTPGLVAAGLALGDNALAYSAIRQSIDAPLWAADPTIDALAKILPEPVGGTDGVHESDNGEDGQLINFRDDVLWAATNAIRTPIGDALGVSPSINENPQAIVGAGPLQSGERFVLSTTGAPLGLIPIAQAIASGGEEELYVAIRQYIDGPLYVVDPTIDALATVLPEPVGGTDGVHESDDGRDGQLINFRDDVLWRTTSAIRTPIANVLGVDPNLDKDDLESDSFRSTGNAAVVGKNNRVLGSTSFGRFTAGSTKGVGANDSPRPVRAAVKALNDQVKESAERIDRAVKKVVGQKDTED